MYPEYTDIISRIPEAPRWWSWGVPRYGPYSPRAAQVYGGEAILVRIACQACWSLYDVALAGSGRGPSLRDDIDLFADISVGDPPNACCGYGAHMQAYVLQVLEFWDLTQPGHIGEGIRDREYEIYLRDAFDNRSPLKNEVASVPVALSIYDRAEKFGLVDALDVFHNGPYDHQFLADFFRSAGLKRAETLAENWITKMKQRDSGR